MALKRVLESLEGLDENLAKLYVEKNGKFFLDAEDEPEVDALRRAKDRETELARQLRTQLAAEKAAKEEIQAALDAAKSGEGGGKKTVDVLEASWRKKFTDRENELMAQLNSKDEYIASSMVEASAAEIADIFVVPNIGKRLAKERLKVEFGEDGKPSLRVLDAAGSPSAMTIADLRKEFVDNKEFAPIIAATKGSGGGANGTGNGNGGAGGKAFKDMSGPERSHLYQTDRARFDREAAALNS